MTSLQHLTALRDKVKAGDDTGFRRANRAAFSTPCQDLALQLREEHCRHAYKGSLDAAKALHEALLPGWGWLVSNRNGAMVHINRGIRIEDEVIKLSAEPNPARAWLLAILKALIAQEGGSIE